MASVDDGVLPDGVVRDVDIGVWQVLLEELVGSGWVCSFEINGCETRLPTAAEDLLGRGGDARILKVQLLHSVRVNVFLHAVDSIDFDVDLRELQTQESLDALCDFLRTVGTTIGRDVLIVAEGSSSEVYCVYRCSSDQFELASSR